MISLFLVRKVLPFILFSFSFLGYSNNVVISNVVLDNDSTVSFSISWENSWRVDVSPSNHDAVWIFLKKRDCASNEWSHVDLSNLASSHSAGNPLEVYVDGKDSLTVSKGLFVRRSQVGMGNISNVQVKLRTKGIATSNFEFQVHGIEMVYIPQGSFYLGDGVSANEGFFKFGTTPANQPYLVSSEDAIVVSNTAGNLYGHGSPTVGTINPKFPKGYNAIYCMKYEITQGQYIAFLNTLKSNMVATGATSRFVATNNINRVDLMGSYQAFTTRYPNRACGFLNFTDVMSYLDWSALRPMSDFEYEKICRGPVYPTPGEYAWGNSEIRSTLVANILNDGLANELDGGVNIDGKGVANCGNAVGGPMRVGYAATSSSNRSTAGATYYGVMDMTGNVLEQTVHYKCFGFDGRVGDGELGQIVNVGMYNVANWPLATESIARGGSCVHTIADCTVRTRVQNLGSSRVYYNGGRGVR